MFYALLRLNLGNLEVSLYLQYTSTFTHHFFLRFIYFIEGVSVEVGAEGENHKRNPC